VGCEFRHRREGSALQLNFWKEDLRQVPEAVWDQVNVEALVLAENRLTEVSDRIGRLKEMR
jgi:hypothetical protein